MKKFLVKFLLLLALAAGCLMALNTRYVATNYWKMENNVWKFNAVPTGIRLANFGSSHGEVGFKYDEFPQYAPFNFGVSSQKYFWDYGILQQYAGHFAPKAVVLLPVSYFGITARSKNYDDVRPRYYRFLQREHFDRWSGLDAIRYAQLPVLSAGPNMLRCFFDVPPDKIDIFSKLTTHMEEDALDKYCRNKHKTWTSGEKGEEGYRQNLAEVCRLVEFCMDKGLQPVLVTTPITTVLNDIYAQDKGFFDTFYRFIGEIQARYGVPYFDYSHDAEFSPHFELFTDRDHLNTFGAEQFTARVVADLQAAGLLE